MKHRLNNLLLPGIVILGVLLRLGVSAVNLESNDNHLLVSQKLLEERSLLSWKDCGSCYHPKLFHGSVALILGGFNIRNERYQILTGQLLNALAGVFLMLFLWKILCRWKMEAGPRLAAFALIALNPRMIGINGQFTNDTYVFLFSTLAILFLLEAVVDDERRSAYLFVLAAFLAMLSKGSGLVIAFAGGAVLVWDAARRREVRRAVAPILLVIISVGVVPFAGNYYQNYQESTEVLGLNGHRSPPPHLWKETYVDRPGLTSVVHGYLTFRLPDLLRHPYIWNGYEIKAKNRTSVWSQVYGRSVFLHFDQWPASWAATDRITLTIGRILLLLGLVPLFLFFRGLLHGVGGIFRSGPFRKETFIMMLFLAAVVLMFLKLTYDHRDFCTMKAIYLWPAVSAIAFFLGKGLENIRFGRIVMGCLIALLSVQVLETLLLIDQLAYTNFETDLIPWVQLGPD